MTTSSLAASNSRGQALNFESVKRELARCADETRLNGFRYWLKTYVRIQGADRSGVAGAIAFEFWPCHVEAINTLEREKRILVLKCRQIGMSWLFGAAYPLWLAMFHPDTTCLLFSQTERDSQELIRKCRYIWERLPDWMRVPLAGESQQHLSFEGMDSYIRAFSSHPSAGSGYTARYAFADEHAKQEYAQQQFNAIRPTVEAAGQFVSNSTAYGTGNFFHELWVGAKWKTEQQGENGFFPLFFPYWVRPGRTPEWWDAERVTYPKESDFFQEYPRDPDEAFQFSAPRVMEPQHLKITASQTRPLDLAQLTRDYPKEYGDLLVFKGIHVRRGEVGVRLYQPYDPKHTYVIGADVSEGFIDGDAQAAIVLCRETGEEVAVLHGHWSIQVYARYLDALAQYYHALLAPERNNHGQGLIVHLQNYLAARMKVKEKEQRPKWQLYHERAVITAQGAEARPQKPGFLTTPRTKPMLFTDLQAAFADIDIRIATQLVIDELRMLTYDDKGRIGGQRPWHDDLAVAVGIAWHLCLNTQRPRARPRVPVAMGQNTKQLIANYNAQQSGSKTPIMDLLRGGPRPNGSSTRQGGPRRSSFLSKANQRWLSTAVAASEAKVRRG